MSKEIYISSTPHETRLAIVEKDELTEIYYERENEYTLAGSIYNGRVTRVLPGMQSSFVDIGLERDAFLYITDFMEEAGESAEFEGSDAARAPRAPREAGGESREGRGDRDRGDRGGRGRRDGRDRGPREAQALPAGDGFEAAPRSFEPAFNDAPVARDGESDEIGEGAPGADGSRRWRGRRGRRRGRGDAPGTDAPRSEATTADTLIESPGFDAPEFDAPFDAPQAESFAAPRSTQPADGGFAPRGDRGERSDRGERGDRGPRRERGGRDRGGRGDRDRGGRGPRSEAPAEARPDSRLDAVRERFAPRGPRPGSAREEYVDLSASAETGPTPGVEPFILPGESLSKYRRNEPGYVEAAPKPTAGILVAAKPSSEAPAITGWDGGAVLPGETLRRREPRGESNNRGAQDEPRRSFGDRNDRTEGSREDGSGRRRGRDRSNGRETFRPEQPALTPAEAVQPAVSSAHDTAEREYVPTFESAPLAPAYEAAYESSYEPQTDTLPAESDEFTPVPEAVIEQMHAAIAEATAEPEVAEAATEFHETVTEYEPEEDASASFRVDPAGAREFRQSAPVAELEEVEVEETVEPAPAEPALTHLQPTGEMISEVAEPIEPHTHADAPIEQEAAVQSVTLHEVETTDAVVPSLNAQGFAPGDGELEEELLDDEDIETGALYAHAADDDMEEETLENAADLGSMIRDMTIDDLTSAGPASEDEDDEDDEVDDFEDDEDFEEDELASNGEEDDLDDEELSGSEVSEAEEDEFAEAASYDENGDEIPRPAAQPAAAREGQREGRGRGRRDSRRGGRDRERGGRDRSPERSSSPEYTPERSTSDRGSDRSSDRSTSERSERTGGRDRRGMANSRYSGGGSGGGGRRSVQATNLPAISDLLKPGQEVLVQIAKEPIAKKGARITSHIALPGRFLVFMPTVSHTGVSRKIESDGERRRLKEILLSERGDATGGFIVRTAAAGASEEELRSDLRFLLNLWADIKARSESSKSPALIYHDLNLIERILRDQVTDNFSAIWCDTETEYERVLRFLQRFQPSLIRRVKLYTKDTPLFEQFGITEEINKALRSKVWLKSGGSIVINQTEALVAIDINTGKFVGKTTKLEDTIVKTNLDAIPEIVRQIRLRDLGGIIIIDFIDMDERKNRNRVMAALEDELKKDRAPSKVLQFNDFGLVAITRKRVKQSLERTLSTTCAVCQGTGMTKSAVTICNDIYIEMRKMHKLIEKGDIMLRVHPEVVKQLKAGGKWLQEMEEMSGKTILVKSDPSLHPEQFDIH
jgi:ribonuclease G